MIYEVYVRSFADGTGDLLGVASRVDYLAGLGVDALWLTPFYRSPMADGGYDVADYRDVDPTFGTLADFDKLLADSHERGIKVIVDLVPNHCSDQHPWFKAAVAAGPARPSETAGRPDMCVRTSCTRRSTSSSCSRRGLPGSTGG